jgi:hypothetical protein
MSHQERLNKRLLSTALAATSSSMNQERLKATFTSKMLLIAMKKKLMNLFNASYLEQ